MNLIDIILILLILLAVWNGFDRGFFAGMAGLVSWIGSLFLTFWLYSYVADFFEKHVANSVWTIPLSFVGCLLLIGLFLSRLMGQILDTIPLSAHRNLINRLAGIVPGIVLGVLYAAIIAGILLLLPLFSTLTTQTRDSVIAQPLTIGLERVEQLFAPVFGDAVNRSINRMTIEPESSERVALPFSVTSAQARPDLEKEMLQMINQERKDAGLSPLKLDEELTPVSRAHSSDMFTRSYFSHISPEGETPFDRIREARIRFLTAGENLAIAKTLPLAHQGLMNSPGHRANILQPAFGRVGIGILDGGIYGLMVTQKFRN